MAETHATFCRICESLCGLEVTVEEGRVTKIRPDDDHVATGGFGCIKGITQHELYDSPDRLTHPMKRTGDEWSPVAWDRANAEIGATVRRIVAEHGPDSVAMYVGTAAGFSVLHPVFAQGFMDGLGSTSMYASATQDCANKFAAAREIYGFPFTQPFPDVDRTECLIIVGANPVVSKWSFLQVADPKKRLREIAGRGGQVIVVDPRRTETAKAATEHVFIRPDTDVFFYLAFLRELVAQGGVQRAVVARHTTGFDDVVALAEPWTPERVEDVTRIPADTLRRLVRTYREANGAALYSSTGVNMGTNGVLCYWLQEVINAVSGNLDRPGGTLVGQGVMDFARFGVRTGTLLSDDTSRIGGFRKVNDAYPGGVLADEILTPGDRQVRALFVTGGNPLITMPNAERLRDALGSLELLVTVDIYRNETGSLAHYTLPATDPFQRADLPFIFPLMLGLQSRPYLQATRRVVEPRGEQRDEATIYLDLARACGVGLFGSKAAQTVLEKATERHSRKVGRREVPQEGLLDLLLRLTRQPSFARLLDQPHGLPRTQHRARSFLGVRVVTDDGKVHLAPQRLLARADRLEADFTREERHADRLKLITKRHVKTHNSWTHNTATLVRGFEGTNHLYLHPDDAERLGIVEGDLADVASDTAVVRVPARLLDDLQPGTC
ncbi:MAG: molybdopterin-dependent oxidoreductase, partial [Acidimicrobiales bacterium]|nr:molybdopterin-dependent oxidoreductase [Acidimicrobiales bacterium]